MPDHDIPRLIAMPATLTTRRKLVLRLATLGLAPVLWYAPQASAGQNKELRVRLKYQPEPKGEQRCANCLHFVPAGGAGQCKIIPGDGEISPSGWCLGWVAAK